MTSTDPSALPDFNGRPVPWITRWTGEVAPDRDDYGVQVLGDPSKGEFTVTYPDGRNNRDATGILWQREAITRQGEPEWACVSTYRQRAAMRRCLCQVCGKAITEKPLRWLMPMDGMEEYDADTMITMQAPVCSECIPLALRLCPALNRDGYMLIKAVGYEPWGVFGQVTIFDEDRQAFGRMQTAVSFDTSGPGFSLSHVWAQQLVIKFDKYVIEETVEGNRPRGKDPALGEFLQWSKGVGQSIERNDVAEAVRKAHESA